MQCNATVTQDQQANQIITLAWLGLDLLGFLHSNKLAYDGMEWPISGRN